MTIFRHQTDKTDYAQGQNKLSFCFLSFSKQWIHVLKNFLINFRSLKNTIFLLTLVCPLQGLYAETIDLQSLNRNLETISALSGQFTQNNVDLLQNRKSEASGRFFFLRPGLMQWIYEKPDPYSIITGKDRIWLYDPILENVTIYKIQNVSGIKIILLLLEPEKLQHYFKIIKPSKMLLDVSPNDKLLFLAHKEKNQHVSEIQLAFDADFRIKQFVIVDLNLNYRKITLNHLNIRPQINEADFEFVLPDGIEIIDKTNEKE